MKLEPVLRATTPRIPTTGSYAKALPSPRFRITNNSGMNDKESAILATLAPGNYTAIVRGLNDTIGIGLVEVYHLQ